MTGGADKRGFAARPRDPDSWIRSADAPSTRAGAATAFAARLTIDITPELRGRIKIVAFQRGTTVADMLRELLVREFPPTSGDLP